MKIKIKSREEIERTLLGRNHRHNLSCYFPLKMFEFCGKVFDAIPFHDSEFSVQTPSQEGMRDGWYWHKDWYDVVEEFTDEDLMDIELMDEMLNYFLDSKDDTDVTDDSIRIFTEELKQRHKSLLDTFKVHQNVVT